MTCTCKNQKNADAPQPQNLHPNYRDDHGIKNDVGKARAELLDPYVLETVASVLTFGANKYSDDNWRRGMSHRRLIGSALRHIYAILRGEYNDDETKLPHWAHAICGLMFLGWHQKYRQDKDDVISITGNPASPRPDQLVRAMTDDEDEFEKAWKKHAHPGPRP
jgi:hypothetical protein